MGDGQSWSALALAPFGRRCRSPLDLLLRRCGPWFTPLRPTLEIAKSSPRDGSRTASRSRPRRPVPMDLPDCTKRRLEPLRVNCAGRVSSRNRQTLGGGSVFHRPDVGVHYHGFWDTGSPFP